MKFFRKYNLFWIICGSIFFVLSCNEPVKETQSPVQEQEPKDLRKLDPYPSFDNTKIAFTDEGDGDAVMLIHGFISSGDSWNKTILKKELLKAGYRVIVPDLRGNGASGKPRNPEQYQEDAEIRDLIGLADYIALKKYIAIGYSRGSIVLAKLLTQKHNMIEKAVLGGMGVDFTNPDWDRRIQFAEAFSGEAELSPETRGAVEYANSIGADLEILSFLQKYQPVTSIKELNAIETETLVIAGDQDKDNGDPAALQQQLPNSTLKIVPGDHNNTYKEAAFAEAVIQFLKQN